MLIFVFWVLLQIFFPCTTTYDGCWLTGKTRGRKESCYGDLRQLNDAMARATGTPPRTKVCLKHMRSIEKSDNQCSSTNRLRDRYGFSGTVHCWIESYLKDRPQCIVLDKILSRPRYLSCGVPQGSVLGPGYSRFISPLLKISSLHTDSTQ